VSALALTGFTDAVTVPVWPAVRVNAPGLTVREKLGLVLAWALTAVKSDVEAL
jgi:hypothetical protein